MKKFVLGLTCMIFSFHASPAFTETYAELIEKAVKTFSQTRSMTATFTQTLKSKGFGETQRHSGKMAMKKPNRMRWEYEKPAGRLIVADGEKLWATHAAIVRPGAGSAWLKLIVHQGRYHEIRRMCDVIGHPVLQLQRIRVGPIVLGRLPKGCWRRLSPAELADIRRAVGRRAARRPKSEGLRPPREDWRAG